MADIPHAGLRSVRRRRARLSSILRDGAGWQGFVLLALGWSGIGLSYGVVGIANDAGSGDVVLIAAALSVASLAAVAGGVVIACTAAHSGLRRVFRSRALFATAATLLMIAAAAGVALVARTPFDGMGSHGKPPADLMNEVTFVAGSLVCVVGGVATLREAWKARRNERRWGGHCPGLSM